MLEQNLLDNLDKVKLRKRFHTLLEFALIIGHGVIFLYCFYQIFLMGFLSVSSTKEFILMLISTLSIGYIYSWHRFSTLYDNSSKNAAIPIYLSTLRFLSFFMSVFLGFIAFLFLNFETYKFDLKLEMAQLLALFFAMLGIVQFIHTLLTPTKSLN